MNNNTLNSIQIVIPKYSDRVVISNKRRVKYKDVVKKDEVTGKATTQKVVANPRTAGQPRYWVVNGQSIYNSKLNPIQRGQMMHKLKDYVSNAIPPNTVVPTDWFGHIKISVTIYDLMPKTGLWDCDNKWPWIKAFCDCIVARGIIPDDNITIVKSAGEIRYEEVMTEADRKLVFTIEKI